MYYFQIWEASCNIWVVSSINTRDEQCVNWNEMYWETYLSDETNTQAVISLVFGQNAIEWHEIMTKRSNWSNS